MRVDKIPKQCPLCTNDFFPRIDNNDSLLDVIYNAVIKKDNKGFCHCTDNGWTSDKRFGDSEDEIRPYKIEDPYSFL